MKNPYSKLIKELDKSTVFVVRKGDFVYLCNGAFMKVIHILDYEEWFINKKPYYLPLNDGEEVDFNIYDHEYADLTPGITPPHKAKTKLPELWEDTVNKATYQVLISPFIEDIKGDFVFKAGQLRVYKCNGNISGVNERYFKACSGVVDATWKSEGNTYSPIVSSTSMILPVRNSLWADLHWLMED